MKSLILKDIFNITHNAKSMLLMLVCFIFLLIPQGGPESYIVVSCLLCAMMIITTFSFDENSKWVKYAMVLPISKKDYVLSKFVVMLIFTLFGAAFGLIFGVIGGMVFGKMEGFTAIRILTLLTSVLPGLAFGFTTAGLSIPLLFKFGAEKARMMMLISCGIPALLCAGIYQLLKMTGVELTERTLVILLCVSPLAALLLLYIMYKISYAVFSRKELNV